jgi:hypothetical protein
MQPILLRSAGLVGLAVAVIAVVSEQSFVSEPQARPQAQVMATMSAPEPSPEPAPVAAEPPAAVPAAEPAAAKQTLPPAQRAAAEQAVPQPAPRPAPVAAPQPQQLALAPLPAAERFAVETPEPPKKTALTADPAAACPRDWVAVEATAEAPAHCAQAAPLVPEITGALPADPALQEAVVERTVELAGLQFAPRLPQARPDAPSKPIKAKARARGKGRLGPPPNCGRKYARWRYVNKVPTWYCK